MNTSLGEDFRALHVPGDPFVIPNPWDLGTARMMVAGGAKALATTSAGMAFALGVPDGGHVTRDGMLAHARDIAAAVSIPVMADFEDGMAADAVGVAANVALLATVGVVGCSIEDVIPGSGGAVLDLDVSVARVRAAVEAAEAARIVMTVTARADGVLTGAYDVDEAIRRLQAFADVGAHVAYAPLLPDLDAVARVCEQVPIPVNVLATGWVTGTPLSALAAAGVARVSLGSGVARLTHRAIHDSVASALAGDFSPMAGGMSGDAVDALLEQGA